MLRKMLQYIKNVLEIKKMKLNREKFIKTINQKWITKNCPLCGRNNWNIGEEMQTMIRVGEDKSIQLGGRITPVILMTCNECGNTLFINPLVIDCTED